jgi:hypothetical protein
MSFWKPGKNSETMLGCTDIDPPFAAAMIVGE